jgi:UDP-glucuronate 4-epimerase
VSIIVTGAAGFIGYHVSEALLAQGKRVIGIDNLNDYYDVSLKHARLEQLRQKPNFEFVEADISDRDAMFAMADAHPDVTEIIHLAAQAGVRYSQENPFVYIQSNVMGQVVVLEAARRLKNLRHIVYASSSSVYGGNTELPFAVGQAVEKPVSLYAATKRADELIAYTYAHLYKLPVTGLRFFTVYGPWGRPDMAPMLFAKAILAGEPIRVFNHGDMARDFTYVDDIVDGVLRAAERPPTASPPHALYNLGNHRSEKLMDFIAALEQSIGRKAEMKFEPMQPGDVPATYADIDATRADLGYEPTTPISVGVPKFVRWYIQHYGAQATPGRSAP